MKVEAQQGQVTFLMIHCYRNGGPLFWLCSSSFSLYTVLLLLCTTSVQDVEMRTVASQPSFCITLSHALRTHLQAEQVTSPLCLGFLICKIGGESPCFVRVLKPLLKVLSDILSLQHSVHMKPSVTAHSYCVWKWSFVPIHNTRQSPSNQIKWKHKETVFFF